MRTLSFDPYEFESPGSEQSLEIAIASPVQHRDLDRFLSACGASNSSAQPIPPNWPHWQSVIDDLQSYAHLTLLHRNEVRQSFLLQDDWNDREVGLAVGSYFVWYHWSTSA